MDPRFHQAKEIFLQACALDLAERDEFVTSTCGENGPLRDLVRKLLAADRNP